jgi:cell shape-determining protein MreC
MARARFKPSKLTLFVGLLLTGFILLLIPQNITSKLNFAFIDIFRFFLNIGSSAAYQPKPQNDSALSVSRQEYNRLQAAYDNVEAQLLEQKKQIEQLARVRMTEPDPATGLVLAKVVNRRKNEFIIDRGIADNLKEGQYVIGDNAVIGCVEQVSTNISSVKLISSSACKIHIKISAPDVNSYFNGTMAGDDKESAKILNVPKKYKVREGYNVYAAPKSGVLAGPRIVGRVSRCVTDETNPLLWDITVKPACDFDCLTDVAVIVIRQTPD